MYSKQFCGFAYASCYCCQLCTWINKQGVPNKSGGWQNSPKLINMECWIRLGSVAKNKIINKRGVPSIWNSRVVLEGKIGKEIPESPRLAFLKKFLANHFALSDAEDNTSGLRKYSRYLCWEHISNSPIVLDSFVLRANASLAAPRTLFQWLLACLNFTLDSEDLFCWYKQKSDFYELWQQHKLLKTMEMNEAWPDIFYVVYIHQFQPAPTHKIH